MGGILGLRVPWFPPTPAPLADGRASYDAAQRLNAGVPLYDVAYVPENPTYYFYPPLLAIVLRPFAAVLPYHVFAIGWEAVVVAGFGALLRGLGAESGG